MADKCGNLCCAAGPFKTCCKGDKAQCVDSGPDFVECCKDGSSCKKNFEQCCPQKDGSCKCCQAAPFGKCNPDGSCGKADAITGA